MLKRKLNDISKGNVLVDYRMNFPKKEDDETFIGIFLVCLVIACQSEQEKHLINIIDLKLQLVDTNLKTNIEVAQELVAEIEDYVSKYPKSTTTPDYYMQLGDLYTYALQLPVKGLYFFQKVHNDFPKYEKAAVALFIKVYF